MSIKKSDFKTKNGNSWDEHHFKTDSGQVLHTTEDGEQTTVEEELNRQNRNTIIVEFHHCKPGQSWYIVPQRSGYALIAAYNIRNDTTNSVKGIQKRSSGDYTVMFNDTPGGELDLWLVWARVGTSET